MDKLHLEDHEVELTRVYPWYLAAWNWYALGFVFIAGVAFFASRLLRQGWQGYSLGFLGCVLGLYCFIKGHNYSRETFWILTNRRLIDVSGGNGFNAAITSLIYKDMADIEITKRGVGAALWNYGTISIASVQKDELFSLENVRHPERIQHLILESRGVLEAKKDKLASFDLFQTCLEKLPNFTEAQLIVLEKKVKELLDRK